MMDKLNTHGVFVTNGASNHSKDEREKHDYYATPPKATQILLEREKLSPFVLEPCCGEHHITNILIENGYIVTASDLHYRGQGNYRNGVIHYDGLGIDYKTYKEWNGDIVTNPPYKKALEMAKHLIEILPKGKKMCLFLRLLFLEGKARKEFFKEHPPKTIYVFSGRIKCPKNGDFNGDNSSAIAFAWFVWEKGFKGKPTIEFVN